MAPSSGLSERLGVRTFGSLRVGCHDETRGPDDLGGARPRQILEILVVARGHPVPKDRLIELLWERDPPKNATAVLESHVSVLRRHLSMCGSEGRDVVVTVPGGYALPREAVDLDLDVFDRLVTEAADAPVDETLRLLEEALSFAVGPVFEDEPHASWATRMRARYGETIDRVRLDAAEAALSVGSFAKALDHAGAVAEKAPANERACRSIMMAAYAMGDQERALRAYLETRAALGEQLGVEPLPETQGLYLAILRHDAPDLVLPTDVRRTETGFRRLVDQQSASGWWTVDGDLRVTSVVGEPGRIAGLSREDVIGRMLPEVEAMPAIAADHRRALAGETVTRHVEVGARTYEIHLEPMRRGNDVVGAVGISADVTERDRAVTALEEIDGRSQTSQDADRHEIEDELEQVHRELQEVVDRASDAMLVMNPWADLIIAANDAAAALLGYGRTELLTRRPSDLHREEMSAFLGFMDRVDVTGSAWTDELTCTTKDGDVFPIEMAATRFSLHRRRTVVAVLRPIERRRETDPALLEALRSAVDGV